ncbi:MAG: YdeI/OmpD-associated family protein [Bacteroidota bacterium]
MQEIETFYPANKKEWRQWLQENHDKKQSVMLMCYKLKAGVPTISWSDAVDEALCFGWIDSTRRTLDEERFIQLFTRRKPTSTWSKVNKDKVARFIADGTMTAAGMKTIDIAKQNGSWTILDEVEELNIPADLEKEFSKHKGSKDFFTGLSKSTKKGMLQWIVMAKRDETRQNRITEIVEKAALQQKPKQF